MNVTSYYSQEAQNIFTLSDQFRDFLSEKLAKSEHELENRIIHLSDWSKDLIPDALASKMVYALGPNGPGFYLIHNLPSNSLRSTMLLINWRIGTPVKFDGEGAMVIEIKPRKDITETSFANAGKFPGHTDLSYVNIPPRFMTMCSVRQDQQRNGTTILADILKALPHLENHEIKELYKPQYFFTAPTHFKSLKRKQSHKAVISSINGQLLFRFRKDKMYCESNIGNLALEKLFHILENEIATEFLLEPNTLLCVDNWRYTHARRAFRPTFDDNDRMLLRTYSIDNISLYKGQIDPKTLTVKTNKL